MQVELGTIRDLFHEDYEGPMEVVERTDFSQDHKYQHAEMIFSCDGKLYSVGISRSGSYHTDWDYEWDYTDTTRLIDCCEVEKVEKVTYVWAAVK